MYSFGDDVYLSLLCWYWDNIPRVGKNIGFIFTTEGVSSQKILIFHYLNERVSAANEWVYVVKYQYFLWTNDWGSENKTNILTHEWDINIIAFGTLYILRLPKMWMASTASVASDDLSIIILFHEGIMRTILYYRSDLINWGHAEIGPDLKILSALGSLHGLRQPQHHNRFSWGCYEEHLMFYVWPHKLRPCWDRTWPQST